MLKDISQYEFICISISIISLWSGAVSYIINVKDGNIKSSFSLFLHQMTVSSFSGFLGGLLSLEINISLPITLCVTGIAGTLGIELLRILQKKLLNFIDESGSKGE